MEKETVKLVSRIASCVAVIVALLVVILCGSADNALLLRIFGVIVMLCGIAAIVVTFLELEEEPWEDEIVVNGRKLSVEKVRTMVGHVHESVAVIHQFSDEFKGNIDQISDGIADIESAVDEISSNASSQAGETSGLSDQMDAVGEVILRTTEQVENLSKSTQDMDEQNAKFKAILDDLFTISQNMKNSIDEVRAQTNATNESVEEIKKVIDIISGIATQTNLLSLNASIEAARAGEAGKGFAVVADEVRALAEQSNESASQIGEIVNTLISKSNTSVHTMVSVLEEIDLQNAKLDDTKETFGHLTEEIESVSGVVTNISNEVETLNVTKNAVMDSISSLASIAERNAETSEETSAHIAKLAESLEECTKAPMVVNDIAAEILRDTGKAF